MTTENKEQNSEEKLYAGKFKTVEDLESGYKASLPVFQENETLKKRLAEETKVPEEYQTPKEVAMNEAQLGEIKKIAKSSALTQKQYETLVRETNTRTQAGLEQYENNKKEIGADNLNLMQDFLKKQYGEKAASALLQSAVMNKELREEILSQRTKALNSGAPGFDQGGGTPMHGVTHNDLLKSREEMNQAKGKMRIDAQRRYINMTKRFTEQNRRA